MRTIRAGKGRTLYGLEYGDKVYLSAIPFDTNPPKNMYATRAEAETEAQRRGCTVEWEALGAS